MNRIGNLNEKESQINLLSTNIRKNLTHNIVKTQITALIVRPTFHTFASSLNFKLLTIIFFCAF